ncbi:MAG: hypothetical protein ACRDB3_17760 [Citrobacter telavivensis]
MFQIETISNTVVKASKRVVVESFLIVDAEGALISGTKAYDTREEAQAKIDSMGNLAEGLAFAKAAFPAMADKALVGKANLIAVYLDWIAAGRPVKSVEEAAAEEVAEEAISEQTPAEEMSEEEQF